MTLLVACGNTVRGDDGVAHAVLALIPPASGHSTRSVQQLTPELACDLAPFSRAVFIDADVEANAITIEPLKAASPRARLSHASTAEEIVALGRALFGFTGEAFLCRVPGKNFDPCDAPAPEVLQIARQAAHRVAGLL